LCLAASISNANQLSNSFEQEKQIALKQSQVIASQMATVDLSKLIPNVDKVPDEANEYSDVTQINNTDLEDEGRAFQKQDPQANAIMQSIRSHPVFTVDSESDLAKQSKIIESNSKEIATSDVGDERCVVKTVQKTCHMPVRTIHNSCTKTPNILIEQSTIQENESFNGQIPAQTKTTGTFTVPYDGVIQAFSATLKSNNVWVCHRTYIGKVNGAVISQMQGQCHKYLGDLHFSNQNLSIRVKKNTPISFYLSGFSKGKWQRANFSLSMLANETKKTAKITWKESCHAT